MAYPGQGIYQSIRSAVKSKTRQNIMRARLMESEYLARNLESGQAKNMILDTFDYLRQRHMQDSILESY